jgi:hypothetical protein
VSALAISFRIRAATTALEAAPQVVAAVATLIGAVEKPITELAGAAANPLNIATSRPRVT